MRQVFSLIRVIREIRGSPSEFAPPAKIFNLFQVNPSVTIRVSSVASTSAVVSFEGDHILRLALVFTTPQATFPGAQEVLNLSVRNIAWQLLTARQETLYEKRACRRHAPLERSSQIKAALRLRPTLS